MISMNQLKLRETIIESEGKSNKPYLDSVGKTTIGIGRNLDDKGLSDDEVEFLFQNDLNAASDAAFEMFVQFTTYSEARQHALIEMIFNLGKRGLMGFVKMRAAIRIQDWETAANEALDSKWARQVGQRAKRIATALREG